jgi:hypothetical protein
VLLFVDGASFECEGEVRVFAEMLCAGERIVISTPQIESETTITLLVRLFDRCAVSFNPAD